jgi:serine/threonine protein kinase
MKDFGTKIDYYKIGKVIGKGAFGKVNLAIHRLTGKFVALKSINKSYMSD